MGHIWLNTVYEPGHYNRIPHPLDHIWLNTVYDPLLVVADYRITTKTIDNWLSSSWLPHYYKIQYQMVNPRFRS